MSGLAFPRASRRPAAAGFLLGFLLGLGGRVAAQDASPFGINAHTPEGPAGNLFLDQAQAAGIRWLRIDFSWQDLEPSSGVFNWQVMDALTAAAAARGLQLFASVGGTPAWATDGLPSSGVPRNAADWTDFCTRSVQRYKTSIHAWGFWNEPNLSGSWAGTRQQFIDVILKPGADAVHAADPGARVASPELAHLVSGGALWYRWLADIIQQMGSRLDVVTHHVYSTSGNAGVTARLDTPTAFGTNPLLWDVVAPSVREVLVSTGWFGRPFWLTESGWASNLVGEAAQASYVTGLLTDWLTGAPGRGWVGKIFFYELIDDGRPGIDHFGILRSDLTEKPAYDAYRSFIQAGVPAPEPPMWVIPGMAYSTGQIPGTIWQSDVTIFNPDTTHKATFSVAFLDARSPVDDYSNLTWMQVLVPPLGSAASGNVLGNLFGQALGAYGALIVRGDVSPLPPVVTARTFNNGDPTRGTFGLSVPSTSVAGGVSSQATPAASVLIGLKQNADAYTNLGLVNLDNDSPKIQLDFLDGPTAAPLASKVVDLKPYESLQLNHALPDAGYAGTSDLYTVRVKILQGTAVYPWASVIDTHSTDPIVVTPTEAPSNAYRLPGIVRLTGANGESWRSRVTVSNPSSESRKVHMVFSYVPCDASGCASQVSLAGDVEMSQGQTRSWDDFVSVWLSVQARVPVDDATSYRNSFLDISSAPGDANSDPLVVLGETYNDTPTGHVGLQVPGYTPRDGASRTGAYRRLALTGLASTTAYRTNLALFAIAGTTGKWVNVHVYSPEGIKVRDIPVFVDGMSQVDNGTLFGGLPGDLSRLSVVVDNFDDGVTVGGYATIIDNKSGDATFVKAQPAP